MPQATSKPVQVTYLPLDDSADMHRAMQQALLVGYYGTITTNAGKEWLLSLTGPGNPRIDGQFGQVLIWNGTSFAVISKTDFQAQYTV